MKASDIFDAVVMLTWSNWETEPRSNRYHYATRFARALPVFFLQHCYSHRNGIEVKESGTSNIEIVQVSCGPTEREIREFKDLLTARGIKKPLFWIYDSMYYHELLDSFPMDFRVYHGTEDYLTPTKGWNQDTKALASSLKKTLQKVDFMVCCAQGVAKSYLTTGGYKGPYVVAENGCDAEFFLRHWENIPFNDDRKRPVAVFQGGINRRLDYPLLISIVRRMPDWEFRFCGAVHPNEGWDALSKLPNVSYLGELRPEELPEQMYSADVGLIPYIQDQWIRNSYPLKAYEYVACGLPVVSVPVSALEKDPALFAFATDSSEFEEALRVSVTKRHDKSLLEERKLAARRNSYDARFLKMEEQLVHSYSISKRAEKSLRVLMLYDSVRSVHVNTIREHLESFQKYSRHEITYLSATPEFWGAYANKVDALVDLSVFDVAIVHYSTRVSVREGLDKGIARALSSFNGLKVLFLQDEYEGTEIAREWMDQIRFNIVYTCIPKEHIEKVYPSYRFPTTDFLPTLTGYVPESSSIELFAKPLEERSAVIAYRGRKLHPVYGKLGYEKYNIGIEMRARAEARGIKVDIETDYDKRLYGDSWYEFLGSARATLGTESGANIFDVDGSLRKKIDELVAAHPAITFEDLQVSLLGPYDGQIKMNQISPKIFEAIRLRTALILFEGTYSGVVEADRHYIPLKKDFSNVDEIFSKIHDDKFLLDMTDRAYEDIVASGRYSYHSFIVGVDEDIASRFTRKPSPQMLLSAYFRVCPDGTLSSVLPIVPRGIWSGVHPSDNAYSMKLVEKPSSQLTLPRIKVRLGKFKGLAILFVRPMWRRLPISVRQRILKVLGR